MVWDRSLGFKSSGRHEYITWKTSAVGGFEGREMRRRLRLESEWKRNKKRLQIFKGFLPLDQPPQTTESYLEWLVTTLHPLRDSHTDPLSLSSLLFLFPPSLLFPRHLNLHLSLSFKQGKSQSKLSPEDLHDLQKNTYCQFSSPFNLRNEKEMDAPHCSRIPFPRNRIFK